MNAMHPMKFTLATLVASFGLAAAATVYTWTGGGEAGKWNDPDNWSGESGTGVPNAGDAATFDSSVTITDAIALAAGTLAITNAADTALTLEGVVSGSGGILKGGAGELHLAADNTFSGGLEASGTLPATPAGVYAGDVVVLASGGLGTGAVNLNRDYENGHGVRLVIDGSRGVTDFALAASSIRLATYDSRATQLVIRNGAETVTFAGALACAASLGYSVNADELSEIVFQDKVTCGSWHSLASTVTYRFRGDVVGSTLNMGSGAAAHLYTDNNSYGALYIKGPLVCHKAGSLRSNVTINFSDGYRNIPSVVDLNGFDQTYTAGEIVTIDSETTPVYATYTNGFASATEAMIHLTGAVAAQPRFNGEFTGKAGLEWAPTDATREMAIVVRKQTTCGEFRVTRGTLSLKRGAALLNLGTLAVGAEGVFAAASDAGTLRVTNVTVQTGGQISLAAGKMLSCVSLTVGETPLANGVYSRANLPDVITGDGTIEVYPRETNGWIGSTGGKWSDSANWTFGKPIAGDRIAVPANTRVVLDEATPALVSLAMGSGSTLVFSNGWNTCLEAQSVSLVGATLTCAGPFETDADKCRVYVKCGTFTMDAASRIDVDGKGWQGGHYDLSNPSVANPTVKINNARGVAGGGWGPGGADVRCGASHFGLGAAWSLEPNRSACYDDPLAPTEPGSGGFGLSQSAYGQAYAAIAAGGGAVFIDATGTVTVNGQILASGLSSTDHSYFTAVNTQKQSNTPGAGGSVRIVCASLVGTGTLRADGGNGYRGVPNDPLDADVSGGYPPPAAGGGGIAVTVGAGEQSAGAIAGMTISAAAGRYRADGALTASATADALLEAEPGTVYLSDMALVTDTIGKTLTGKLVGLKDYTYAGDLDWTAGHVRFGTTGVTVRVTGNLTLSGASARLDIGGVRMVTNGLAWAHVSSGDEKVALSVGGNLTVGNSSALVVYAAEVPGESAWGADVTVGGAFSVSGGGTVHPVSDGAVGGAPHFTAASFALAADGVVTADGRGGAGVASAETLPVSLVGIGPGGGTRAAGGSHGGVGALGHNWDGDDEGTVAAAFDDEWHPICSGSGGGSSGSSGDWLTDGGNGGGVFHLSCTGPVVVNGVIRADGRPSPTGKNRCYMTHYSGSGAGGSVYLAGSTVSGAGRISARGGDAWIGRARYVAGCGGGGRVLLQAGEQNAGHGKTVRDTSPSAAKFKGLFSGWTGAIDVSGGTNSVCATATGTPEPIEETFGSAGTVRYSAIPRARKGVILLLR